MNRRNLLLSAVAAVLTLLGYKRAIPKDAWVGDLVSKEELKTGDWAKTPFGQISPIPIGWFCVANTWNSTKEYTINMRILQERRVQVGHILETDLLNSTTYYFSTQKIEYYLFNKDRKLIESNTDLDYIIVNG